MVSLKTDSKRKAVFFNLSHRSNPEMQCTRRIVWDFKYKNRKFKFKF